MNSSIVKAGATYFGLVFGAGFLFGIVRLQWAVPRFGQRTAELIEMPFMLLVVMLAARWTISRFSVRPSAATHLLVGLVALGLLLLFEFTLVLGLQHLTLSEYFATRDPVSGTVYAVMLGFYALMPWLSYRWVNKQP